MAIALLSFAAIIVMLVVAGRVSSTLEWSVLLVSAVAQLALLFIGWGDFANVHQGFVLLMLLMFIGIATCLGELFLAIRKPSRARFVQLISVAAFTVLLLVLGDTYGR
jgi:hypothetical protein